MIYARRSTLSLRFLILNLRDVAHFDCDDDNDQVDPRFNIVFTTKKLMERANNRLQQDDTWFSLLCFWDIFREDSSPTGRFFPIFAVLSSHKDTFTWTQIFKFVHHKWNTNPSYRMVDGAREITKGGIDVFGESSTISGPKGVRLMCWSHVIRNTTPQLIPL